MGKNIDVENLNIYYGSFLAVQDVTMTIRAQTVTALIGPSGCGKSTFLRSINRMHEVIPGARVEGRLALDGRDLYGPGVDPVGVRRQIGMVFQRPNPFPTMSIYDNVVAGMRLNNKKAQEERPRRAGRALAARRQPLERGEGPARPSPARASRAASSSGCASRGRSPCSRTCC